MTDQPAPKNRVFHRLADGTEVPVDKTSAMFEVLRYHMVLDYSTIDFACLECGSIATSEDREARDQHVDLLDLTCCGNPETTVLFHTSKDNL